MDQKLPRSQALKTLLAVPIIAMGAGAVAQAADNKSQFKYQNSPKGGAKCSGCKFFKAPHGCSIVTGSISPNGWCVAYSKK